MQSLEAWGRAPAALCCRLDGAGKQHARRGRGTVGGPAGPAGPSGENAWPRADERGVGKMHPWHASVCDSTRAAAARCCGVEWCRVGVCVPIMYPRVDMAAAAPRSAAPLIFARCSRRHVMPTGPRLLRDVLGRGGEDGGEGRELAMCGGLNLTAFFSPACGDPLASTTSLLQHHARPGLHSSDAGTLRDARRLPCTTLPPDDDPHAGTGCATPCSRGQIRCPRLRVGSRLIGA